MGSPLWFATSLIDQLYIAIETENIKINYSQMRFLS